MKSVMTHDFSRVPSTEIERSTFDRSHGIKTAFDSGYLVPILVDEVLPGDTVDLNATLLLKTMPTVSQFMDNLHVDTQWFFVPNRLIWTNFTKMMGERVNPNDSIDYTVPMINSGNGFAVGSLADYFGIPTGVPNLDVSALPFRAMAKIWDDWYRDENLQNSVIQSSSDLGDSNGTIPWNTLYKRGKRHDYFTSALPNTQKGPGVELPLGGFAPINGEVTAVSTTDQTSQLSFHKKSTSTTSPYEFDALGYGATKFTFSPKNLTVDLTSATAATINSLRMAFQLQKLLERDMRGGTRYCEILRSHFRTISPDARLQRSEFLGSSSQIMKFDPVSSTFAQNNTALLSAYADNPDFVNLAVKQKSGKLVPDSQYLNTAFQNFPQGWTVSNGKCFTGSTFTKSFTEHGWIIGLVSVRADLNYQQGLNRMWSRKGRYDFYWPALSHLGEQAVLNKEIYAQGKSVKDASQNVIDDKPFGYQERYAEYRYFPSMITGKLRSQASDSLDVFHLAQKFTQLPLLNADFIQENPPLARVLSLADSEPQLLLDGYISMKSTRPLCVYAVPGLSDHF